MRLELVGGVENEIGGRRKCVKSVKGGRRSCRKAGRIFSLEIFKIS